MSQGTLTVPLPLAVTCCTLLSVVRLMCVIIFSADYRLNQLIVNVSIAMATNSIVLVVRAVEISVELFDYNLKCPFC